MATLTKKELVAALEQLLPPLDPTTVTLGAVMADLAQHFGVDAAEFKARHKPALKHIVADMIHLCQGGDNKENDGPQEEEDEDEEALMPKKTSTAKRARGRRIEESDEEEDDEEEEEDDGAGEEAEDDDDAASGNSEDDSEDERPVKRRKQESATSKKERAPAKRKPASLRKAANKPKDFEGMAALKELARVAGVLSPAVYAILKKLESEEEQEAVLRERLQDAGVRFSSPYPKKSDISAAKRKREKEKELDGIDTSLIITGGRSRRAAAQKRSYVTTYEDEDEDENAEDGGEGRDVDEELHDHNEDESEAHDDGSEASDESEAEF